MNILKKKPRTADKGWSASLRLGEVLTTLRRKNLSCYEPFIKARMGERRGVWRVLVLKPEGKRHLEDPGVDGTIILRWIFRKWDRGHKLDRGNSG